MVSTRRTAFVVLFALSAAWISSGCSKSSPTKPAPPAGKADLSAPILTVSSPARSAMLAAGTLADGPVAVSGTACDSTDGIASLTVLGSPVAVSGDPTCQPFDVDQPSRWGLNIVTADATSAGGATDHLVQSYLRSPTYFPAAAAPNVSARVPLASVTVLNQSALDDGSRTDVDDLATILEAVLGEFHWNSVIPTYLAVSPDANGDNVVDKASYNCVFFTQTNTKTGYLVRKTGAFTRGTVRVEYLHANAGNVGSRVSITNLSLPLSVTGYADFECVGANSATVTGTVRADELVVTSTQHLTVNSQGGLGSSAPTVTVAWTNLRVEIDWGVLSFISGLLDTITNEILDAFESGLVDALGSLLADEMPDILESVLPSLELTLPSPMGTALGVSSGFAFVSETTGSLRLGLNTQYYPKNPVLGRAALPYGALRKDGTAPVFSTGYDFAAGIKDDALNQFLWAAWAGGAFDFVVTGTDPCLSGNLARIVSIRPDLPPVLMPGRNGHELEIGLGDLYVEAEDPAMAASGVPAGAGSVAGVSYYVSGIAGLSISVDPATQTFRTTMDPDPEFHVQTLWPPLLGEPPGTHAAIEAAVRCFYEQRIASVIGSYALPVFDLGGLPGVAPGTKLGIANAALVRAGDYTILTGSVESE